MWNWKLVYEAPERGHRFFKEATTGDVACADWSGSTPDRTDDGVLWLDPTRPLQIGIGVAEKLIVSIPLLGEDGLSESWTGDVLDIGVIDKLRSLVAPRTWDLEIAPSLKGPLREIFDAVFHQVPTVGSARGKKSA